MTDTMNLGRSKNQTSWIADTTFLQNDKTKLPYVMLKQRSL